MDEPPRRGLRAARRSGLTSPDQVTPAAHGPSVDGARIPPKTSAIAPCRSTSIPSMQSAPAIIPATIAGTFSSAFTPVFAATLT